MVGIGLSGKWVWKYSERPRKYALGAPAGAECYFQTTRRFPFCSTSCLEATPVFNLFLSLHVSSCRSGEEIPVPQTRHQRNWGTGGRDVLLDIDRLLAVYRSNSFRYQCP